MNRRTDEHDDGERHVEKEHGAPADMFDEPAAGHRADRRRDRAESRPRADRATALGARERRADDREAAWHEERRANALQRATDDEHLDRRRDAADDGCAREYDDAPEKHSSRPN